MQPFQFYKERTKKELNKAPQPSLERKNKKRAKQGTPAKFRKEKQKRNKQGFHKPSLEKTRRKRAQKIC